MTNLGHIFNLPKLFQICTDGKTWRPFASGCFGLRFGEWESEVQAQRRPERSRSETTIAVPQAEARRSFGIVRMPLVTSARFAKGSGHGGVGDRADQQPAHRSKPCVGHGGSNMEDLDKPSKLTIIRLF
jgi:hypothetical protein